MIYLLNIEVVLQIKGKERTDRTYLKIKGKEQTDRNYLKLKGKQPTSRNYLKMQAQTRNQELEQLKKLKLNTERRGWG